VTRHHPSQNSPQTLNTDLRLDDQLNNEKYINQIKSYFIQKMATIRLRLRHPSGDLGPFDVHEGLTVVQVKEKAFDQWPAGN
jgi:hypothetical protein